MSKKRRKNGEKFRHKKAIKGDEKKATKNGQKTNKKVTETKVKIVITKGDKKKDEKR